MSLTEALGHDLGRERQNLRELVHDLRSPLTAVQIATETLRDGPHLEAPQDELLQQMVGDVERLTEGLRQGANGRAPDVDPVSLIRIEAESAAAVVAQRGAEITCDLSLARIYDFEVPTNVSAMIGHLIWCAAAQLRCADRLAIEVRSMRDVYKIRFTLDQSQPDPVAAFKATIDNVVQASGGRVEMDMPLPTHDDHRAEGTRRVYQVRLLPRKHDVSAS